MKKTKTLWLFPILLTLILTGCGQGDSSEASSSLATSEGPSSSEVIASLPSSSEEPLPETISLSEAKLLAKDSDVTVGGVVGKIWIGSTQVVPQGFYLFDEETTLFVYGPDTASQVSLGNHVILSGKITWYIIETDLSGAEKIGYEGAIQVASPVLLYKDGKVNSIPQGGIVETTIRAITEIPVTQNITSTFYRAPAKIIRVDGANFQTYYFVDLSLDVHLLLYTSANGNDHRWLDAYVNQTHYVTFIVHNVRVADAIWRITPVAVQEETSATPTQLVDFALNRLKNQFEETYYASANIEMTTLDSQVPDATITYTSNHVAIVIENGLEIATLTIDNSTYAVVSITIRVQYLSVDKSITFDVVVAPGLPDIETQAIDVVRDLTPGTNVAVQGILMAYAYYGSTTKQGFYVGDETAQIVVYVTDKSSLDRVAPGEMVIASGVLTLSTRFGLSIDSAVIEYQDYQNHPSFTDAIETISLSDLLAHQIADNITSLVFRVNVTVEVTTGMYSNVYLHDPANLAVSVILYSTGSSSTNAVARALEGQTLDVYMTLISRRYPDGGTNDSWRGEMLAPVL